MSDTTVFGRTVSGNLWLEAWVDGQQQFPKAQEPLAAGIKVMMGSARAALDCWLAIANEELIRARRMEDFLDAQRKLLNVCALQDHIVPPPASTAPGKHVGTRDHTELALPGGHAGARVSGKHQGSVGAGASDWLLERQ